MRKLIIIFITFLPALVQAQVNLVRNGSFEQYSSCPTGIDQIKRANYWQTIDSISVDAGCTPEYCNNCADAATSGVNVPYGADYFHYARTGKGMVESNMYFDNSYTGETAQRNYTQGHLISNLTNGTNYCVTFYVTLAQVSGYANNKIGAYLDNGGIDAGQDSTHCGLPQMAITPQIIDNAIINDTLNWVKIQGSFISNGTERIISIGNFSDFTHTNAIQLHYPHSFGPVSFYLIDDVSVIESNAVANAGGNAVTGVGVKHHIGINEDGMPCTWYAFGDTTAIGYGGGIDITPTATGTYRYVVKLDLCGHVTYDTMTLYVWPAGVGNSQLTVSSLRVYPNPATNEITIENAANCDVVLYDFVGRIALRSYIFSGNEKLNISKITNGIYMLHVIDAATGEKIVRKIMKE